MPLRKSFIDFFENLRTQLRAALSVGLPVDQGTRGVAMPVDSDFEGWLRNDPIATENPTSRYGKGARGYITGNGRGTLEIGAADD